MEATHKISAVYLPNRNYVELTWEDIDTEERASLTVQVDKETGEAISRVVPPCVCCGAVLKKDINKIV